MTYSEYLAKTIRKVVRTALDAPPNYVRPANQTVEIGNLGGDFATVNLDGGGSRGTPTIGGASSDAEETQADYYIDENRWFTASVQFWKSRAKTYESSKGARIDAAGLAEFNMWAYDMATRLPSLMWRPEVKHLLHGCGLAYIRPGKPRNLTALNDSVWESRGQVDLEFSIACRESFKVNLLAGVSGRVIVSNPGGTKQTIDIEV